MPDWFWPFIIGLVAGEFIGFFTAAILAAGRRADENEPVEHAGPNVMPRIWQGKNESKDEFT